jgi:hypothetical protein
MAMAPTCLERRMYMRQKFDQKLQKSHITLFLVLRDIKYDDGDGILWKYSVIIHNIS